jgi:uncharacterized protein YcbK (DUF882 family)
MARLTEHFTDAEMACPCGKCDGGKMSVVFMEKLQKLRTLYNKPMTITSAYRCKAHNAAVGGAATSMHTQGRAADIAVANDAERYQLTRIAYAIFGGVGHMHHALHVDDRDQSQARAWTYPTRKAG